ncbi:hypothetical protein [Fimbriiglobus ruber]|uniref:Uncharacterized protein n=1 Tax=Fimbriiglobus ruber TaxID=1908690 RepID=A0A225DG03_9BACT|nr:hypothetical protein [Fimbriiglobus ruber]OWK35017.1 hypothetical protein FRUB_09859 [Fimbriiglobus ruber]
MSGATVVLPTPRLAVVVPPSSQQDAHVRAAVAGKNGPKDTFAGTTDATSQIVVRGAIWIIVRETGGLSNYMDATTEKVDKDLKAVRDKCLKAPTFGLWSTPGGNGVRFGAAFQCQSDKDARDLVKAMEDGPYGKGDESETGNQLKSAASSLADRKTWSDFMQNLSFRSKDGCAYIVTTVSPENADRLMSMFNSPTMAIGDIGTAGGGGGMPGMMPGPGGGGPGMMPKKN